MHQSLPLVYTLAVAFGLALIFGYLAEKLKFPALVGYLLAGIMASSHTPGPVADMSLASQLSEVGIMLLMFGVGLHFSIDDLMKVKNIAVTGAVLQMTLATVLGCAFAVFAWDWQLSAALIFGLCLSCASTIVMLKALEMRGSLKTIDGQISVGWLIVEDIATVLILVLLPPVAAILGTSNPDGAASLSVSHVAYVVLTTILRVVAFVVVMFLFGRKLIPWALWQVAKTGSRELFTLSILACAIGIAFAASTIFEVSFALGAFFAGMVMRESKFAQRAARDSLPLQDAFSVLFFVGVGMMFDWHVLIEEPLAILTMLAIIIFGKSLAACVLVHLLRYPLHTSLSVGAALAQIGEFSYILAAQGIALKMVDESVMSMIVAASFLSIAFNPVMFALLPFVRKNLLRYFAWARAAAMTTDPYAVLPKETSRQLLVGQTIIVGTGAVSELMIQKFAERDIPHVCIVNDKSAAEKMRERKIAVITGDASDPMVLVQAHIITAVVLVLTGVDAVKARKVVDMAKQLNPDIDIYVRAESSTIVRQLKAEKIGNIIDDRNLVADGLVNVIADYYNRKETESGAQVDDKIVTSEQAAVVLGQDK